MYRVTIETNEGIIELKVNELNELLKEIEGMNYISIEAKLEEDIKKKVKKNESNRLETNKRL